VESKDCGRHTSPSGGIRIAGNSRTLEQSKSKRCPGDYRPRVAPTRVYRDQYQVPRNGARCSEGYGAGDAQPRRRSRNRMVRVRTERCHGFTTLTIVLVTAFKSLVCGNNFTSRCLVRVNRQWRPKSIVTSLPALQRRRLQIVLGQSKAARANPFEATRRNSVWCQERALVSRCCAILPGAYNLGRCRETQV
jgi:hypothetical protein